MKVLFFCLSIAALCLLLICSSASAQGELSKALNALGKTEAKSDSTLKKTTQATDRKTQTTAVAPKDTTATDSTHVGNPQADNTAGSIVFDADTSITNLERSKRGFKEVKGYRIQIAIGPPDAIKKERNTFLSLKLPYSAYLKQIVPEYALQVGDFHTRMEMEKHLEIIKKHYPKAFSVVEVIEPMKFGK